jgi:hypothetical protein
MAERSSWVHPALTGKNRTDTVGDKSGSQRLRATIATVGKDWMTMTVTDDIRVSVLNIIPVHGCLR